MGVGPVTNKGWVLSVLVFASGALVAHEPALAQMMPVPRDGLNLQGPGFQTTIKGDDWSLLTPPPDHASIHSDYRFVVVYHRQTGPVTALFGTGGDNTAFVTVTAFVVPAPTSDPQALGKLLQDQLQKRMDAEATTSPRNRLLSSQSELTQHAGATCIRAEWFSEDRGVPHHEGEVFATAMHRLLCLHPDFPSYFIDVDFSTRSAPGEALPASVDKDGMAAIDSLVFEPFGHRITTIVVGTRVTALASTKGTIWASYGGSEGKLARIDSATNRIIATIPIGNDPVSAIASDGSIWVVNNKGATVSRVDPATNKLVATIAVGNNPLRIASGAGALWVGNVNDGTVSRIDPASNRVTATIAVGGHPSGVAFASGMVLATDYTGTQITRVDPSTNAIVDRIPSGHETDFILPDGQSAWITDQSEPSVRRLDLTGTPHLADDIIGISNRPSHIALMDGNLWVACWGGIAVSVVDLKNPAHKVSDIPTGIGPRDVLSAEGAIWVANGRDGTVTRLDPKP
jgi:YVTN family beta-propeller protein